MCCGVCVDDCGCSSLCAPYVHRTACMANRSLASTFIHQRVRACTHSTFKPLSIFTPQAATRERELQSQLEAIRSSTSNNAGRSVPIGSPLKLREAGSGSSGGTPQHNQRGTAAAQASSPFGAAAGTPGPLASSSLTAEQMRWCVLQPHKFKNNSKTQA